MRIIKNINSATACALYNKGVRMLCAALDSLTKGDRKKMENYLVVTRTRAWYAVQTHVGKELIASFLCLICVLYLYTT